MKLILDKTPAERFQLGMRLIESGRKMLETRLMAERPDLTRGELTVAIFERCHGHLFSPEARQRVAASILDWHRDKEGLV